MSSQLPIVLEEVRVEVNGTAILRGISLELRAGAPTVLIGPNGSGKTTLLRVAMGLVRPSSGRISWAGTDHGSLAQRALVFQRPVMLRRTVADNLSYALAVAGMRRADRRARVRELLAMVGLEALADRPAPRLSGGERQRLALARALARQPAVLFLDEPTASLDPAATLVIENLVRSVTASGVKVVMTTHDLGEAARLAGDVVLLHRGELVEAAPAEILFQNPRTATARKFLAGQLLL